MFAAQEVPYWFRVIHFYIMMQCNHSNCNSIVLFRSDFASTFVTPPSLIDRAPQMQLCSWLSALIKRMYVWINSSHCCMADILLNVRQAKYLFSTIFVGTNSDCDVINALCPKATITWKFFSYVFWQWDQYTTIYSKYSQTCLSELRSTRIPAIWNKLLGADFSQRILPLKSGNLTVRHQLGNWAMDMSYQ